MNSNREEGIDFVLCYDTGERLFCWVQLLGAAQHIVPGSCCYREDLVALREEVSRICIESDSESIFCILQGSSQPTWSILTVTKVIVLLLKQVAQLVITHV